MKSNLDAKLSIDDTSKNENISGSWISCEEEMPKNQCGKFWVITNKDQHHKAFFYKDGMVWRCFYGFPLEYWWDSSTKEPIKNVTHWFKKNDA